MADLRDFDKAQFLESGAIFAKADRVWLLWGASQKYSQRPDAVAVFKRNFHSTEPIEWVLYPYAIEVSRDEAIECFSGQKIPVQWTEPDQALFRSQFDLIQKKISAGEIDKVVPYTMTKGCWTFEANHLEGMIGNALLEMNGFLYGMWKGTEGSLGLSPEILISQESHEKYRTMALAGTCSIEDWESNPEAFENDPKEKAEHFKVVEDIVDQLENLGRLEIAELSVATTPQLAHLLTLIQFFPERRTTLERLVTILHPTPALGTYPRGAGKEMLLKMNEQQPRGTFGAPFGISYNQKKGDVVVAIRGISWVGSDIEMGAGCGVVSRSQFDSEWNELAQKRASVQKIFGLL